MRKSLVLVFLFSLSAQLVFSQKDPDFEVGKLKITVELAERNYKKTPEMRSVLTLTNNSTKTLPASGWTVYFNGAIPRSAEGDTTLLKVEMINGDYIKLYPGGSFKGLVPNSSVTVNLLSRELKNITDYPKGFYIVFNNAPLKGIKLNTEMISALDHQKTDQAIAEKQYAQNSLVKAIPEEKLNPVFPTPVSYSRTSGFFNLGPMVKIKTDNAFSAEADYLSAELGKVMGVKPGMVLTGEKNIIVLQKKPLATAEGYELNISPDKIVISASSSAGIFYGIQSLKILLPPDAWAKKQTLMKLPGTAIKDSPRFGYRAFMMDLARNFQQKKEVLKVIDLISLYKINVLHLHLNDDEGWRIEIPGLPELTEVGSKRGHTLDEKTNLFPSYGSGPDTVNPSGSGFLSKLDFIEILKYATARHIQVVPEFETPGHARAAIKSMNARYEKLLKQGNQAAAEKYLLRDLADQSVYRSVQGWNDNVINPAMPSVYVFLTKITDEVIAMYKEAGAPLKTIHFGGDEVPAGVWEKSPLVAALLKQDTTINGVDDLWHYYFNKLNVMLKTRGLYLSGWEETGLKKALVDGRKRMIVDPRLSKENLHAEVWNNLSGNEDLAYKLANAGYQVILTNVTNMYLDLAYNGSYDEPGQYWGGYVDVDKPFNFIPLDYYKNQKEDERGMPLNPAHFMGKERLTAFGKSNIIGLQTPLWSEIITSPERLEYLLLPKLFGLAERSWAADPEWATQADSTKSQVFYNQSWSVFTNIIGKRELPRLNSYAGGFAYRIPTAGVIAQGAVLKANVQYPGLIIRYTTDGSEPSAKSKIYTGDISEKGMISFRVFNAAGRPGRTVKYSHN